VRQLFTLDIYCWQWYTSPHMGHKINTYIAFFGSSIKSFSIKYYYPEQIFDYRLAHKSTFH
jgi:hypothetical protein